MSGRVPVQHLQDCSIHRCISSWERQSCQRKILSLSAVTSVALLLALLMLIVFHVTWNWQDTVGKNSTQDLTFDPSENTLEDCKSTAAVVKMADEALLQKWESSANLSQVRYDAEENAKDPAHIYIEKHHAVALYLYTNILLQSVNQDSNAAAETGKQLGGNKPAVYGSIHLSLGEAVQTLKHSQVTCLHTNYRTDTALHLNISNKQIHFSSFVLASSELNFTSKICLEVYTCFGADITYYSALKLKNQILIPPYEVFKVTDTETNTDRCQVVYRLKSNLNCVYDVETNMLHPISASPLDIFWLIFIVISVITIIILILFVIVKVLEKHRKTAVSSLHTNNYSPARVVL
ncbi:T-cell ecto-ADP-ribosyltransferase 1-like [Sphaeramia orbicularis]|uniref:T-cell ecto-ADP-ribosyltransferase 1-like n=1 Tax=Sphaeramia orbicularis TaxID=375764 RepID=UPI00117E472B|nr:T-cell ecto-ADP-ribosyltransferase 1-like [Sphaeramia orbicularis]